MSQTEETNNPVAEPSSALNNDCHQDGKKLRRTDADHKASKKLRLLEKYEEIYLKDLPQIVVYEKSYMHRDVISHALMTSTQFLVTCAIDGTIKFWKKTKTGIDFVKHLKCHDGPIEDMIANQSGNELASVSRNDKLINIFDVVNFDMINFIKLSFEPKCIEWIQPSALVDLNLAVSDFSNSNIYLFDARQADGKAKRILNNIHECELVRMRFNPTFKCVISVDARGEFKYWHNNIKDFKQVKRPISLFDSIADTDLSIFLHKEDSETITLHDIRISPNGSFFITSSSDRKIRIFHFRTGKLVCCMNESLKSIEERHKTKPLMAYIDFLRKMTIEKEIENSSAFGYQTAVFDQSGLFIIYPNIEGIKIVNWKTGKVVKVLGSEESLRPLCITLFQGTVQDKLYRISAQGPTDPTLFCTAYKKNRFYMFTNRNFEEPTDDSKAGHEQPIVDRDIFNEPKTKEELLITMELNKHKHLYSKATIYTSMGDIKLNLFRDISPKAVENFCALAKDGYYNSVIFHRVIKDFMIQSGDPSGTGKGGESTWGGFFCDELSDKVDFSQPFMLAMANTEAPDTNGSQFFITVASCEHLNNKHTIFGKVIAGMEVCQNISKVKTVADDKPLRDVTIINIQMYN